MWVNILIIYDFSYFNHFFKIVCVCSNINTIPGPKILKDQLQVSF